MGSANPAQQRRNPILPHLLAQDGVWGKGRLGEIFQHDSSIRWGRCHHLLDGVFQGWQPQQQRLLLHKRLAA
ncbi:hypothetical protein NW849_00690 [Synechococcus sp. R55.3]|uniref:hypothetical protein n=1 Tax=unclassified Synechococcus TaxID=2626047 RepID=UPI0039C3482C